MSSIRRILVAVDFSSCSNRALEVAIDFASQFGSELHVVHAYNVPIPFVTPYEVAIPDAFIEETHNVAKTRLGEAMDKIRSAGLSGEAHLAEVPAHSAIARTAEELDADLIVIGTHGHTGLKHVLLGSVAERTLRHAPCSVLTVKAAES